MTGGGERRDGGALREESVEYDWSADALNDGVDVVEVALELEGFRMRGPTRIRLRRLGPRPKDDSLGPAGTCSDVRGTTAVVMGDDGRIVVPVEMRTRRRRVAGTTLVLVETQDGLLITERETALRLIRERLAGAPLVDELIEERRRDATRQRRLRPRDRHRVLPRTMQIDDSWSDSRDVLLSFPLNIAPVTRADAEAAARPRRRGTGLSLADRLCLALGAPCRPRCSPPIAPGPGTLRFA